MAAGLKVIPVASKSDRLFRARTDFSSDGGRALVQVFESRSGLDRMLGRG